jgi:hypothetical protein
MLMISHAEKQQEAALDALSSYKLEPVLYADPDLKLDDDPDPKLVTAPSPHMRNER